MVRLIAAANRLSFATLGGFWLGHNHLYHHLEKVSTLCLAIHVYLMAVAAFFPFCAHLLGRYPGNTLAVSIWLGTVWCYALGLMLLSIAAEKQGLFSPDFDPQHIRRLRKRLIRLTVFLFIYLVCFSLLFPVLSK